MVKVLGKLGALGLLAFVSDNWVKILRLLFLFLLGLWFSLCLRFRLSLLLSLCGGLLGILGYSFLF